jgi:carbamoylphosphate synthase large subunit
MRVNQMTKKRWIGSLNVLVTGIGGPAGRACAHFFKEQGCFVVGTDMRSLECRADVFRQVPPVAEKAYLPNLLTLIDEFRILLLVPTISEELPAVSGAAPRIRKKGCSLFMPTPKYAIIAGDKYLTARFLGKRGVDTPMTILQERLASAVALADTFGFPMLAKPRFGRGGRGVVVYRNLRELSGEKRNGLVFQEFIPGEEFNANLFVYPAGRILVNQMLRKTALKEGVVGNALAVEPVKHAPATRMAAAAAMAMRLSGTLDIDIRLRADGTPVILEINARPGANVLHTPRVLQKLLETWKKHLCREEV